MQRDFNPDSHFSFLTNRVSRLIMEVIDADKLEHGFSFPASCIGLMAQLWEKDGQNQKELGEAIIKNKSSINKMLLALEQDGMVSREKDPVDGRNKVIKLTNKGRDFKYLVIQKAKEGELNATKGLQPTEVATAKKVLAIMYRNLKETLNSNKNGQ